MNLFELYMCKLDININYRYLWDVLLFVRVTNVALCYVIAYYDFIDCK